MVTKEALVVISELSEHVNAQAKVVGLIHPKGGRHREPNKGGIDTARNKGGTHRCMSADGMDGLGGLDGWMGWLGGSHRMHGLVVYTANACAWDCMQGG